VDGWTVDSILDSIMETIKRTIYERKLTEGKDTAQILLSHCLE
jgi:hypothetical protein